MEVAIDEAKSERYLQFRANSYTQAIQSFGYAYAFQKRINKYNRLLKLLKVSGILIPATLAITAITFYSYKPLFSTILVIFSIVSVIQFFISIYAVNDNWDIRLSHSYRANASYNNLFSAFKQLWQTPPLTLNEFEKKYDLINKEYDLRRNQDQDYDLSDEERRRGMRSGLREFQEKCSLCHEVPYSMNPTACDVCGNFKFYI